MEHIEYLGHPFTLHRVTNIGARLALDLLAYQTVINLQVLPDYYVYDPREYQVPNGPHDIHEHPHKVVLL